MRDGVVIAPGAISAPVTVNSTWNLQALLNSLPPLASNVPHPPRHYVPRRELMAALVFKLHGDGSAYVTGQAVASGDGGHGKTVLAEAYALERAGDYPGGRFMVGCESGALAIGLAALLPVSDTTRGLNDDQRCDLVRARLSQTPRCLLILDNVKGDEQWRSPGFRALLPVNPCHVLVTTRAERLSGINAVPVGRLTEDEAIALLKGFRPSAHDAEHRVAVGTILREVEHLAAVVAAVGAVMELDEDDDWAAYAAHLAAAKLEDLPDAIRAVRDETGYAGKTVVVLDDLRNRLPAAELRVLDYATILPADQIVPAWLESLLNAEANAGRGEARLDLGRKVSGTPRTPKEIIAHLRKLDLLRPAAERGLTLTLHRLHRRRAAEIHARQPALLKHLWDEIEEWIYVYASSGAWLGVESIGWYEAIGLFSLGGMLDQQGRPLAGAAIRRIVRRVIRSLPDPPQAIQAQAASLAEALEARN